MIRLALFPTLLLFACQPNPTSGANPVDTPAAGRSNGNVDAPDAPVSSEDPPIARPSARPSSDCPIIDSSDWAAWINAMPTVPPRKNGVLIVKGKVTVPTGGYRIEWADFRVAESYPVQIFADLRVIPPGGGATQAVTTHEVRGDWPMDPPVGSMTVRCGERVLARIAPVQAAY